ncbi:hypothetical protein [Alteribacillus sp. HJP-4]|uniref:hypothetical protein n=1 Tax=Alteribacillus sp. HJP-4 TaxID=2775394 RepID=UPI0035CCD811
MEVEYIRDYAMYTGIFGMFSFMWFGWAQENPRKSWRKYLGAASVLAMVVCLFGVYLSVTHWQEATALSVTTTFHRYIVFVWIEFFLAGIGAIVLLKRRLKEYVAPWIAFIVGIHFFWLTSIFQDGSLIVLGVLLTGTSLMSLPISRKLNVAASAVTGIGFGTLLFFFALSGLIRFLLAA